MTDPEVHERSDRVVLLAGGLLLLLCVLWATVREGSAPWRDAQDQAAAEVAARQGPAAAAALPRGLQQIWLPDLGRVDRCTSCHVAVDGGPALRDAPHPVKSHPYPDLLAAHPVEEFGCTLCHGGQGWATTKEAAHGEVEHWDDPLLGTRRAERHGLTRAELMEMRCNLCHRHEREVAGMPLLNEAKAQIEKRRCLRCHTLAGVGEATAPDLTYEGDKHPSHYVFPEGWKDPRTALTWHLRHFERPDAVVPGSMMPTWILSGKQAAGLALLVLSWRKSDLPPRFAPRPR